MTRVYDALRQALEDQNGTGAAVDMPPGVEFEQEAFPPEAAPARIPSRSVSSGAAAAAKPVVAEALHTAPPQPVRPVARELRDLPEVPGAPAFERITGSYEGKTVLAAEISPQSREQYRRLAASLHHAQAASGLKVVMITSALVGEGKTLTAANIALTLSESYQKQVLLIDADLRRPSMQAVFGLRSSSGLAEGLTASDEQGLPVHHISSRLGVLQAGAPTSDPIAALTSDRMRRLLDEARQNFDWVLLDTPPVALLTDASLLSAMTDGALMVVKAGHTPYELVERAVAAIGRDRTLGVVLNHADRDAHPTGQYGDYYKSYSKAGR